jgi:hypothetical protein
MTASEHFSRSGVIVATAPAFVMLLLFYSLAIHMYLALGGWPESIGERGFPATLIARVGSSRTSACT